MKISDLTTLLTRIQQIAGDVDITLQSEDGTDESVITDLGFHLDPTSGDAVGSLVIEYGTPPPAAPADPPPADPPPAE